MLHMFNDLITIEMIERGSKIYIMNELHSIASLHVMSQIVEISSAHTLNFQVQVHKDKLKCTWVQRVFGVKCNKQKNQGVKCAT